MTMLWSLVAPHIVFTTAYKNGYFDNSLQQNRTNDND